MANVMSWFMSDGQDKCPLCGYEIVVTQVPKHARNWYYCSNKLCPNHAGEIVWESNTPKIIEGQIPEEKLNESLQLQAFHGE